MIQIKKKSACCGCGACSQACPRKCIILQYDNEGFLYPTTKEGDCIDCGLCNNVCPIQVDADKKSPLEVVAYKNPNEQERFASSSGGLFVVLARQIIKDNGVVFGVSYDENWMTIHTYAEDMAGVKAFMGSKYVQSRTGDSYKTAKEFLLQGRKVLYSGTPCQIAGLRSYLRKDYENLLTVEIMCHGVPSPGVWNEYLKGICPKGIDGQNSVLSSLNETPLIDGISFRDKTDGWSKFGFVVYGKSAVKAEQNSVLSSNYPIIKQWSKENPYMQAFLSNVILRPSCYDCKFKSGKSGADFSIGDFWSIATYKPELNDDKGVTLAYILSEKGISFLETLNITYETLPLGVEYNSAFKLSAKEKYPRAKFWMRYRSEGLACINEIYQSTKPGFWKRMQIRIINRIPFLNHKI